MTALTQQQMWDQNREKLLLKEKDHVGVSFWLVAGCMAACSIFFYAQAALVPREWSISMIVAGSVTSVAWLQYANMKEVWTEDREAPIVARYMDWIITVPLQILEFYLLLSTATPPDKDPVSLALCARLTGAAVAMLAFGYMGETEIMSLWPAFVTGCACWLYIVWELFYGEAAQIANQLSVDEAKKFLQQMEEQEAAEQRAAEDFALQQQSYEDAKAEGAEKNASSLDNFLNTGTLDSPKSRKPRQVTIVRRDKYQLDEREFVKPTAEQAYDALRMILLAGWAIYPLSYAWYHLGGEEEKIEREDAMNALYNLGDLVNKIAFGIAVYSAAGSEEQVTKQLEHRVIRIEMKVMKDWMNELKKLGIVHKKFRGDLKSWLNMDESDAAAGNKEVGGKQKLSSSNGASKAGPGVMPFLGGASGAGGLGAGGFGGSMSVPVPGMLPAANPMSPTLLKTGNDNLSMSMANNFNGASIPNLAGQQQQTQMPQMSSGGGNIYQDVVMNHAANKTIAPSEMQAHMEQDWHYAAGAGVDGDNSFASYKDNYSLHHQNADQERRQWTDEEWAQWREQQSASGATSSWKKKEWTAEEWAAWEKEKNGN
eukprot:CAMPEP_0179004680 /NCGR_PEP_ID=MMETSP0795-20121207/13452_1 /TAXON_ID=88552 /ORGANISM="Amoebophrya sp., Strain Ameob2" /LENGTH=596 /DNA_ID=CAMNT_0020698995 /DNA_START=307 /DNA_END=2097 /DNA_ORIENTATION=+